MRAEKYMNSLNLIRLNLKNLKLNFFVPHIFLFLAIPVMTCLQSADTALQYENTYLFLQFFAPFFALWWAVFGFREYMEGRCREALLVYKKSILPELLTVFVFYFLHVCLLLLLYYFVFGFNYFEYIFVFFTQAFAFFSFAVSLSMLMKNIAVPFIISILYEIFCMYANTPILKCVNMLSETIPSRAEEIFAPYAFVFIGSVILLLTANSKFKRL